MWAVAVTGVATYSAVQTSANSSHIDINKQKIDILEEKMKEVNKMLKDYYKLGTDTKSAFDSIENLVFILNRNAWLLKL